MAEFHNTISTSAAVGPCRPHTTSLTPITTPTITITTTICNVQGSVPIDMNTGNPPTFLQRAYGGTEPECLNSCSQQSQCMFVGYSEQNTLCLMLTGTPSETHFQDTILSSMFWYERRCLGG